MASIRRRNGRYQARTKVLPAKTFTFKKDAERYCTEDERRSQLGDLFVAPAEQFGSFLDNFIERKRAHGLKPRSIEAIEEAARRLRSLRDLSVENVRRADVEDLISAYAVNYPTAAQKALRLLKETLRSAQARGQRIDQAVLTIKPPRHEPKRGKALTAEQLYDIAAVMPDYIRNIVPIAGLTGMREGELLALRAEDVCLGGCEYEPAPHLHVLGGKTKAASRKVVLGAELTRLVREQKMARPPSEYLFPTESGKRWDRSAFMSRAFRPARKYVGLDVTFHHLRHTAISLMALSGWLPEHIATQVGHKDGGALILRRYRHVFPGEVAAQVGLLDSLVNKTRKEQTG